MQRQYRSSAQDCFFLFKLCYCWILFMGGMTNGLDMMSSSGTWLLFYAYSISSLPFYSLFFYNSLVQLGFNLSCVLLWYSFRYVALLVVSLVCYMVTLAFSGILFHFFTPSGQDCGINTFFIVMTLMLVFVFAIVALHPAVS